MAFIKMKENTTFPQLYNSYCSHSLSVLWVVRGFFSLFYKGNMSKNNWDKYWAGLPPLLLLEYCATTCLHVQSPTGLILLESQPNVQNLLPSSPPPCVPQPFWATLKISGWLTIAADMGFKPRRRECTGRLELVFLSLVCFITFLWSLVH